MKRTELKCNGLFLAAFSSLVFALCSVLVKQLEGTHPVQLCLYGFIGVFFLSGCQVLKSGCRVVPRGCALLILLRSICGCSFFVMSFYSVQMMPLGDASVLLYTTPVWTLILARIFLKEPCKNSSLVSICVAMIGVVFVTQPEVIFEKTASDLPPVPLSSDKYTLGALAAIIASISEATGNVVLRKLKSIDPFVIMFNYSLFSILFCLLIGSLFDYLSFPQLNQIKYVVVVSVFTTIEQCLMAYALTLEHVGPVAIVQASDIIYGYILEVVFYDEEINSISLVGAVIVGLVVVQMALSTDRSYSNKDYTSSHHV